MFYLKHNHYKTSKEVEHFLTNYMNAFLEEYNSTPEEHQKSCKDAFDIYKKYWGTFSPSHMEQ